MLHNGAHTQSPHITCTIPTMSPLQDFGEHGREFISSEIGLRLLQVLADPAQLMRYAGSARRARRLQRILQNVVLKVGRCMWCSVGALVRHVMCYAGSTQSAKRQQRILQIVVLKLRAWWGG